CQIVRQVASQRQVQEVMADFWLNHFNVFARKGLVKLYAADYVERAIRPNALGRFEDLLVATARHPAMLLYLDNAKSSAPPPPGSPAARQHRRGITENYARELLELHTLGVDGGYTQNDVIEVARVLTGWSVSGPEEGDLGYKFRERLHDRGEKIVLGQTYPAGGGEDEGLRLLHQLAEHPSTARHLARKLCERFVADRPPASCVESAARAYLGSNGDIRVTLRAIEESPEFWENRGNKLKSPLRFVVSALRSVGAKLEPTTHLSNALNRLGQGLLLEPVPTGYPETAEEWASAGSALARMHFATLLGTGRLPGVSVDTQQLFKSAETADQIVVSINDAVLGQSGSPRTVKLLTDQLRGVESPEQRRAVALALALGSPDFQRQ
ncbi:MAG TPA: DUF1800 domain-containing protein, partial [Polyangiaceae bacterium]